MIAFETILFSSFGAAILNLMVNGIIKTYEKKKKIRKQTKIFIEFIDRIIIRYLNTNINQYQSMIDDLEKDFKIHEARKVTESPMLSKEIFEFFEKDDLIKIFSYSKNYSIANIYHFFHEIDFLQKNSPKALFEDFTNALDKHYLKHKKGNETFFDHIQGCNNAQHQKIQFKSQLETQKNHTKELLEIFEDLKNELNSIDELIDDGY
jgi:hypothetical protein